MCSGLDRNLFSLFVVASRRAHYTLHQVLKHVLKEGSESDNESSEDEKATMKKKEQRVLYTMTFQTLERERNHRRLLEVQGSARFGAPGDIRIFDSSDEDGGTRDIERNIEDGDSDTPGVYDIQTDKQSEEETEGKRDRDREKGG